MRALQGVSKNRLNDNLRELQRAGVVRRRVYVGAVTRVEYEVSPLGRSLCRIVEDLRRWGERNRRTIERERGKPLKRR